MTVVAGAPSLYLRPVIGSLFLACDLPAARQDRKHVRERKDAGLPVAHARNAAVVIALVFSPRLAGEQALVVNWRSQGPATFRQTADLCAGLDGLSLARPQPSNLPLEPWWNRQLPGPLLPRSTPFWLKQNDHRSLAQMTGGAAAHVERSR